MAAFPKRIRAISRRRLRRNTRDQSGKCPYAKWLWRTMRLRTDTKRRKRGLDASAAIEICAAPYSRRCPALP